MTTEISNTAADHRRKKSRNPIVDDGDEYAAIISSYRDGVITASAECRERWT